LSIDDAIAFALLVLICAVAFLAFILAKLVLGMLLLNWARERCLATQEREGKSGESISVGTRRLGINGMVEVPEEARKRIYEGDESGLAKVKEKEERGRRERDRERERGRGVDFGRVERYGMVAKRIW
jgi:DNA-binding transcriptional ArsR family regulator